MANEKLTKIQEEFMVIFWKHGSLSINNIIKLNRNLSLSVNTIRKTITLLVKKGFLEEDISNTFEFATYVATITYEEYLLCELENFMNIGTYTTTDIVKALISGDDETYRFNINDDELIEIHNLLADRIRAYFEEDIEEDDTFEDYFEEELEEDLFYAKDELDAEIDEFLYNFETSLNNLFLDDKFYNYVLELQSTISELKMSLAGAKRDIEDLEKKFSKNTKFVSDVIRYIEKK